MDTFAIKIDLSEFFTDPRKLVMILVDPQTVTKVSELQTKVALSFQMPVTPNFTSIDGYFISPSESIGIMRFVEKIKGFMPPPSMDEMSNNENTINDITLTDKDTLSSETRETQLKRSQSKRKFSSVNDDSNSKSKSKKKRSKNLEISIAPEVDPVNLGPHNGSIKQIEDSTPESVTSPIKKKKKRNLLKSSTNEDALANIENTPPIRVSGKDRHLNGNSQLIAENRQNLSASNTTQHIFFDYNEDLNNNGSKKKRFQFKCQLFTMDTQKPRVFLANRKEPIKIQAVEILRMPDMPVSREFYSNFVTAGGGHIQNSTVVNYSNVSNVTEEQPPAGHSPDGENTLTTNGVAKIVESLVNAIPMEDSLTTATMVDSENEREPIVQSNSTDSPNGNASDNFLSTMEDQTAESTRVISLDEDDDEGGENNGGDSQSDEEEIIELSETDDNNTETNSIGPTPPISMTISEILPFCTDLCELPKVNDIILFKLSTRIANETTNFIKGKCLYVNRRLNAMTFKVLDGRRELHRIDQKSYCFAELDTSFSIKRLTAKLHELIEPKLFVC